ncbi:interferon-inducible GTPase 5-like [Paramuricea clavata]|uniref:Interferon-inducible GTPase 5-like n=1 Tax=Paramuricea clavata TaxID=317549 RepID=A0A7D9HUL3_PARCT|nr:interferon-inducible GTPase 5-like [Paramuricea clavata]
MKLHDASAVWLSGWTAISKFSQQYMATSNFQEAGSEESSLVFYLDVISKDDVELDIAIVGENGSGRSCFVNAIRGLEEDDRNAAKPRERETKELNLFVHPENPNIRFWILTMSIHDATFPCLEIEKYDAFLIFTAGFFSERHKQFAEMIKYNNRPLFFIRIIIDYDLPKEEDEILTEQLLKDLRRSLAVKLQDLHLGEDEIYLISNHHPNKWDFLKLTKAIADALPSSKKECFIKIPKIQELVASEKFQDFIQGIEAKNKSIKRFFGNVHEVEQSFLRSGIVGVQRAMKKKLERWKEVTINLAIVGNSGVGKSSFINTIRGLEDNDPLAAETGIEEKTQAPTPFYHPTYQNVCFWDLPGIGTPTLPDIETFCKKFAIEKYDTFLIMSATRFTEYDLQLAMKIQSMEKSFFFIRTKIDNDKKAEKRKLKKEFNEEEMLKTLRNGCVENLQNFNFGEDKIFLISNWAPTKWDFDRLKLAILDQLPSKQKELLTFSLCTCSKTLLKEKIQLLRGRVWMTATASVASKFGLAPSLRVDEKLITSKIKFYRSQLEFPENNSEEFKMLTENLQKRVEKFYLKPDQPVLSWLKSFDEGNAYDIKMYGPFMVTNKPFKFVHKFLNLVLDDMEETALEIFDEATTREQDDVDSDESE